MLHINSPLIAHRGASAYAPENTFAAFERALALGLNAIEFDVILSKDGEAFVFHDNTLQRTTNGFGEIGLLSSEYLHSLDAGTWYSSRFAEERIPLFRDVLRWALSKNVQLNVEIKPYPGMVEQTVIAVLSLINQEWPHGTPLPLVSSFEKSALQLYRTLAPEQPLGFLMDDWDEGIIAEAKALDCTSIHVNYQILNSKRIQIVKHAGFALFAYTVNKKRMAKKLLACGVDALFTDYPDLLL